MRSGDGGLAENRGPVRQTGGSGIYTQTLDCTLCLKIQGGIFAEPGAPASSGSASSTTLGYRPPGWPPGGRTAWRSFAVLLYSAMDIAEQDGRFA